SQGTLSAASKKRPKAISREPEILLSRARLGLMANPVSPAIAPMMVKTSEKPKTKLSECRNVGRRIPALRALNSSGPTKLAKYTGTSGKTHGDRKDNNPAVKAMATDIFSTLRFYNGNAIMSNDISHILNT
ncbi:MAG: hypothetical protein AMJ70_07365, partial [Dehalococcoidia bacterium SG8_51_3]